MGTAAPPGPTPTPEQIANFEAIWKELLGDHQSANPATVTHNSLNAAIELLSSRLTPAAAKAKTSWDAIAVVVSPLLESDQVVPAPEWQAFLAAATAKQACATAKQLLAQISTEVNNWWANASQTDTGTGPNVPAVPVVSAALVSAVNTAVSQANALS